MKALILVPLFVIAIFKVGNAQISQPPIADSTSQPMQDTIASDSPVDTSVTANNPPPELPEYTQPECPQDGYLWQPGYWAYNNGYYWVPGVWVAPPNVGYLWTPPYWGFYGGIYAFHVGYWGNSIGFYGGINYGFGYGGVGFVGGAWRGNYFSYNTAVLRVNTTVIHNTYVNRTVINNTTINRTSFNGQGGIMARPNNQEIAAMHGHHIMATAEQNRNQRIARADKSQFSSANGGRPANLAAAKVPPRAPVINGGQKIATNATPGIRPANGSVNATPGSRPNGSVNATPGSRPANGSVNATPGSRPSNGSVNATPGLRPANGSVNATPGSRPANGSVNATPGSRPANGSVNATPGSRPGNGSTSAMPGYRPNGPANAAPAPRTNPSVNNNQANRNAGTRTNYNSTQNNTRINTAPINRTSNARPAPTRSSGNSSGNSRPTTFSRPAPVRQSAPAPAPVRQSAPAPRYNPPPKKGP